MEEKKRLSVVIEHWIEHNEDHMDEYRKWAQRAEELGLKLVAGEIKEAIGSLSQTNLHLKKALEEVG
ncbi:MAG: hypothetical protein ACPL6D_16200 [Thermodesulfobacteriota bacterium]